MNEKPNQKELLFCEEFIKSGSIKETAEALEISRTTCHEYLKKPEVKAYLEELNQEKLQSNQIVMNQLFCESIEQLFSIIKNDEILASEEFKLKAIEIYLKHYEKIIQSKQI